jgi:release factor glutamine methyltransferase
LPAMNGRQKPTPQSSPVTPPEDSWSVGRLLTWTTDYLKRHGSESARLDAEVMLSHVLDWQRVQLYTHFEEEVSQTSRTAFRELVRDRALGTPVAYLVGRKEFYSLSFAVSPAVLIPRPESEFVVVEYLEVIRHLSTASAVDVGTGSGCLAIASAHHHHGSRFVAIDASEPALAVARRNAAQVGVSDRIDFRCGDCLQPVAGQGQFDAIVSNPPYIPSESIDHLEPGVRDHEPRIALDGGPGGLDMVARLIEESVELLKPGGHLILEIGAGQDGPVRALILAQPRLRLAPIVFDHSNHPRVIRATRTD